MVIIVLISKFPKQMPWVFVVIVSCLAGSKLAENTMNINKQHVYQAVKQAKYVSLYDIHVAVDNGVTTVTGRTSNNMTAKEKTYYFGKSSGFKLSNIGKLSFYHISSYHYKLINYNIDNGNENVLSKENYLKQSLIDLHNVEESQAEVTVFALLAVGSVLILIEAIVLSKLLKNF